jgi:hypothetical protein
MRRSRGLVLLVATLLGVITVVLAPPPSPASAGVPAPTINTFEDLAPNPSDGLVTLRESLSAANADGGLPNAVILPSGVYELTRCGNGDEDNSNATGDLDLVDGETILQTLPGATIRQTCPGQRVIENLSGDALSLQRVSVTGGTTVNGRGAGIWTSGPLFLSASHVVGNIVAGSAAAEGGGIFATDDATVTLTDSTVTGNEAFEGGGVNAFRTGSDNANVVMVRSSISGNVARRSAGGVTARNLTATDSTIAANEANGGDANTVAGGFSTFTQLVRSTVSGNRAGDGSGVAVYGQAMRLNRSVVAGNPGVASSCDGIIVEDFGFNVTDDCFQSPAITTDDAAGDAGMRTAFRNGGTTVSVWPEPGSPAIDHIAAASCTGATDQRLAPRPGGSACDAGAVEVQPCGDQFSDVATLSPFCAEIGWMSEAAISTGFEPGPTYRPRVAVSRGAMSAFMFRLAGNPPFIDPPTPTFGDVGAGHPFFTEVEWMASEGITTGTPASPKPLYKPGAAVSRAAMSAFMFRLAGEPEFDDPPAATFLDVAPSHPFFSEVEWMASEGITTGTPGSPKPSYKPSQAVSRAAMSAFMYRLADGHVP